MEFNSGLKGLMATAHSPSHHSINDDSAQPSVITLSSIFTDKQLHTNSTNVSGSKTCSEANCNMLFLSPLRRILPGISSVSQSVGLKNFSALYTPSRSQRRTR
jgi:hypothetical protein